MYERYCQVRDSLGYKDSDVAKATGMTRSTFTDWKNGRSKPKIDKIQRIASFLGISPEYLLNDVSDEPSEENNTFNISVASENDVDVESYINNILDKLKNHSGSTGAMYFKGVQLTDVQIDMLADDLENALNRVIKLSERSKSE